MMSSKNLKRFMTNKKLNRIAIALLFICTQFAIPNKISAQVNAVTFGKNRIQYHKYNWRFYQTKNFNVHFTQNGLELAKYTLQAAEEELASIEAFTEQGLQGRANIILYNSYEDKQASNIGLDNEELPNAGETRLVNNKMVIYFDGNHEHLRQQIREGIAKMLVDNKLFGDNIGQVAGNQALLDLPQWLTDGYTSYAAENWSQQWDDQLRSALLSGSYNSFYQFAFDQPTLAGHAFWKYIADKYKKENVTYFMYLAVLYKNLNTASLRITKKKFKEVLSDFMVEEPDIYYKDLRGRKAYPKGSLITEEDVDKNHDVYRFAPNPNPKLYTWGLTEYNKGRYNVVLIENYVNRKVLISNGVRVYKNQKSPNYPIMAWDGKGSRLAYVYWKDDKIWLQVFDIVARINTVKINLSQYFDQVQDVQYMLDKNTLIISAVKNGHSDLFIYKTDSQKLDQLTNDVWDDLDGSFVSFPNKYGIIFASNRPGVNVKGGDTSLPSKNPYNIFLIDAEKKGGNRQITQLTNQQMGNARFPMQYNMNHFTFVSDQSGISNRYAGFFTTKAAGLDTLVIVGDEILRNPPKKELDSTLRAWNRTEPDSIGFVAITKDSTYTFPMTNYQSSMLETRIAGDKGMVSEVTQQGDFKFLYRLRVDSNTLRARNVTDRPTPYMRSVINEMKAAQGKATNYSKADTIKKANADFFQGEFSNEKPDSAAIKKEQQAMLQKKTESYLDKARLYKYRLKFSADQIGAGLSNMILVNRFQPYTGGSGPIRLNNEAISWALNAKISDVMEDYVFAGGVKTGLSINDPEYFFTFQNRRKRIDWGATYYRLVNNDDYGATIGGVGTYPVKFTTNLYQGNLTYPFDQVHSLRLIGAYRVDRYVAKGVDQLSMSAPDQLTKYANLRAEYVYDNTINPAQNIWNGLRWKVYMETMATLEGTPRQYTYNFGFDARNYVPIYRNIIWALRAAGDFSWGNQKMIYYVGGVDGDLFPKFNNANKPATDQNYAFQSLALNLRGFNQNAANGNNAVVINSEIRVPVFSSFVDKPINNALLRNFQVIQFLDLGTAWNGSYNGISRPSSTFTQGPISILQKAGGIGPFAGGYGFGARTTLLGYFIKTDCAWQMTGLFNTKPIWYLALGLDF